MPFTIDVEKMNKQASYDVSAAPNSPTGIPVKQIPILEFPRVVYKHPKQDFRTILHRNNKHEVVHEEVVPAEHMSKLVNDRKELEAALKEGWHKEPYIPKPVPVHAEEDIY